jgi:alpha-galactosidase/6-phospho-beta-glucosidase family protein
MAEEYAFPPYGEEVLKAIEKFGGKKMETYDGDDVTPLWDLKGGPILMNIARKMEKLCPDAWLLDFANPVAVLSAAVNNHTSIKCLGVCAGYTNHLWDLPRLLGKDEQTTDADIDSAGINHMSFITGGTMYGQDIYDLLEKHITEDWQAPELSSRWNESAKKNISNSMNILVGLYRQYGYMVFSSEGDGLAHLDIEHNYLPSAAAGAKETSENIINNLNKNLAGRKKSNELFASFLDIDMSDDDWNIERPESLYLLREDQNIMVKIIKALAGVYELKIATSYPNYGAIPGFTDRTVLEYSQILSKTGIKPVSGLKVPDVFYGLTSALASHQTLLGDAIATEDPKILFEAFYSYPVKQDTKEQNDLWKALLELNKDELPAAFQKTKNFLS